MVENTVPNEDRVKIWNSYLYEAYNFAKKLKNGDTFEYPELLLGGTLPFEKHYALMTILYLALAIDARTNHLLHELEEKNIISRSSRESIIYTKGEFKWAILPLLVGKEIILFDKMPHQVIKEIYAHRNNLVYLPFDNGKFIDKIPDKDRTIRIYNYFIKAMENMNVILGRSEPNRGYVNELMI